MRFSYSNNLLDNADFELNNFGTETPYNWTLHKQLATEEEIKLVENTTVKDMTINSYSTAGRMLSQSYMKGTQTYNTLFNMT
ncbi:hypothetical protein GC101_10515 [Paenibacillus sp. LMG 31459]|uniref:Uncharacterized protein n=1 Tax=Paenibacillus phytohabitans TaxID=2654978 RepID=A0ABX1YG40_9BACL|nr:hypothetical protein [Paenibacillus phytohabitans]